ncbi:MAG: GNAT family acetyltransferase [Phycisphaeraceae bacterium]|nr:GNAT family acetyltransferase [Phycisphaeraceae bacterium]
MNLIIRCCESWDAAAVIDLWRRCGLLRPWNDPREDFARKLAHSGDLFLMGVMGEKVVAAVMAGYDGHRGWINYLAVDPLMRRQGIGRRMMDECQTRLERLGCPKINLQVRATNREVIAFYQAVGYKVDEVVSLSKRID